MFYKKKDKGSFKKVLNDLLIQMEDSTEDFDSERFELLLKTTERVHKMKTQKDSNRVSGDMWVSAAGNLAGIIAIIHHERLGVITSKALGFVMKSKI